MREDETNSDDEVVRKKKTSSGESQASLKSVPCSSSSKLVSKKQPQLTPTLSKKALMEGLLLPDTRTVFNPERAREIFVDNANVGIVVSEGWGLRGLCEV